MKILVALTSLLCYCVAHSKSEDVHEFFYVKPGGKSWSHEKELNDYKCTFTYEAQGGTHEEWHMNMATSDSGDLHCIVDRIDSSTGQQKTSYLFFEAFSMSLTGPGVSVQEVFAVDTGSTAVEASAYKLDKKINTVSHVAGKFKNHLERVTLIAKVSKTEL